MIELNRIEAHVIEFELLIGIFVNVIAIALTSIVTVTLQ